MKSTFFKELRGTFQGKQGRHQQRWHRRFIVLSVLTGTTLAVSSIAIISYQVVRGLILDHLKQQALLEVQQGSDEIDQWLATRKAEVETLANSPIVRSSFEEATPTMDWSVAEPYLQSEVNRIQEFLWFVLANSDGSFANTRVGRSDINISDREWFISAMTGQVKVDDPVVSRSTGILIINIGAPIAVTPDSQPLGVFGGVISVDQVVEIVGRLQQGSGSYAFALNSEGVPIAHPDSQLIGTPEQPAPSFLEFSNSDLAAIARRMVDKRSGIELAQVDGAWQYVAYVPLKQADWSIALVIPRQNIESQLGALNLLASVLGGLLVIALVGAWRQVQSYEQTRTRAAQEALLNRLTSRIRESLDLQTIVQTTVMELAVLTQLEQVVFGWHDPQLQQFELVYESCSEGIRNRVRQLKPDLSVDLDNCLRQGETVRLQSVSSDSGETALELTLGHYVALAIAAQDGRSSYLIGLHAHPLSQEDRELLQAVAGQLAIAVTQAHLYSQTQEQVKLLNEALAQLRQTQSHLIQSEKMSGLGQLVAGIAHEINNPVNFIYGNLAYTSQYTQELLELLQLYQQEYPHTTTTIQAKVEDIDLEFLSEDLPKLLSSMRIGSERIREIVQSLRIFSRLDEAEFKAVNIHEGIDSTLMILQSRLKAKAEHPAIQVVKQYGELPQVECYAGQLNQVFMNILSNSIDAIEEQRSQPTSSVIASPTITIHTEVVEPEYVAVRIVDNGPGMTEEVRQRLFDPFFTTKPVGKGTGMGLSISYQIVTEKHWGELWCISSPGQGAEFFIKIPAQQLVVAR